MSNFKGLKGYSLLRSPLHPVLESTIVGQNTGAVTIQGYVRQSLGGITQSLSGEIGRAAVIDQTLFKFNQSLTAAFESYGPISQTLNAQRISQSLNGVVSAKGSVDQRLSAVSQSASANTSIDEGDVSTQLHGVNQIMFGYNVVTTSISMELGYKDGFDVWRPITTTVNGEQFQPGTVRQTLYLLSQSANAHANEMEGSIVQTLGAVNQSASASTKVTATMGQTLFAIEQIHGGYTGGMVQAEEIFPASADQTLLGIVEHVSVQIIGFGIVDQTLFAPSQSVTGWAEAVGSVHMTLYAVDQQVAAHPLVTGSSTQTLGALKQSVSAGTTQAVSGSVAQTLGGVTESVSATIYIADSMIPSGRLALVSGTPFPDAEQTAKTTVYYTPALGNLVPVWNGSAWGMTTFSEVSQALSDTTHSPAASAAWSCYDLFVWSNSGTITLSRGPAWSYSSTVTVTSASPGVVTWNGHGLAEGTPIVFSTTGSMPTGLTAGTVYFVRAPTTNTFEVSATQYGTAINTSSTGSGVSCTSSVTSRASGGGLTLQNGLWANTSNITNGPNAGYGLYVGTIMTNGSNQLQMNFTPAGAAGGSGNLLCVWNMYNRRQVSSVNYDSTTTWTYATESWRPKDGNFANTVQFVIGIVEEAVEAFNTAKGESSGSAGVGIGVNINSVSACANGGEFFNFPTASQWMSCAANMSALPNIGFNYLAPLEQSISGQTATWFGSSTASGSHVWSKQAFTAEIFC